MSKQYNLFHEFRENEVLSERFFVLLVPRAVKFDSWLEYQKWAKSQAPVAVIESTDIEEGYQKAHARVQEIGGEEYFYPGNRYKGPVDETRPTCQACVYGVYNDQVWETAAECGYPGCFSIDMAEAFDAADWDATELPKICRRFERLRREVKVERKMNVLNDLVTR